MNQFQVIVLATPLFFVRIGIEFAWGHWRERRGTGRKTYRFNDILNSIGLGELSQLGGLFSQLLALGIYTARYVFCILVSARFLAKWCRVFSGAGVLRFLLLLATPRRPPQCHFVGGLRRAPPKPVLQPVEALRQTSSGPMLSWMFYVPMALVGVPPLVFGIVALIDLVYQFWVHTEQVGTLGWFDRVFLLPLQPPGAPRHHRREPG